MILGGGTRIAAPGAEVLATYTAAYPPRGDSFFFSQAAPDRDTDEPVLIRSGRLIYAAAPLFTEYARTGYGELRRLLQAALGLLLPDPLVVATVPMSTEVALLRQGERMVCLLVPYAPQRGEGVPQIDEWPPLGPVSVGVRGEFRQVETVLGSPLSGHESEGGYTHARWTSLQGPAVVVFS